MNLKQAEQKVRRWKAPEQTKPERQSTHLRVKCTPRERKEILEEAHRSGFKPGVYLLALHAQWLKTRKEKRESDIAND